MSVIRYILILTLISTFIFQSHFVTVLALTESDVAINSLDDLEIQSGILQDIVGEPVIIENKKADIEADISSLIAAKIEYRKSEQTSNIEPVFIVNPFHEITETTIPIEENLLFENFLKPQDS